MNIQLRVLHLEDNPHDAELIQAAIQSEGIVCHVARVESRADFLASIEQGGFDLILADYTLPSFDGLSALNIALERCPDVPFIFVSGTLGEEVAIEALKIGATDYLLKERLSRIGPSVHRAYVKRGRETNASEPRVAGRRETAPRDDRQGQFPLYDPRRLVPACRRAVRRFSGLDSVVGSGWQSPSARRRAEPSKELYRRDRRWLIGPAAGSCGTAAYRKEPVIVSDIADGSPVGRLSRAGLTTRAPSVLVDPGTSLGWPGTGNLRDILPGTEKSYATAAKYHRTDHRSCEHRDRAQAGRGGASGPSLVPGEHGSGEPRHPGNERPRADDERCARRRAVDLRVRSSVAGSIPAIRRRHRAE